MGAFQDSNKTYGDDQSAVADIINVGGVYGALTVGLTAVEIKVGGSRLTGRKSVTLYNNSNRTMYWGFDISVTTSTGTPIEKNQMFTWSFGQDIPIYVITDAANQNARITESA